MRTDRRGPGGRHARMCTGLPPAPDIHATPSCRLTPAPATLLIVRPHTRCEPPHRRCPLALRTRRAPPAHTPANFTATHLSLRDGQRALSVLLALRLSSKPSLTCGLPGNSEGLRDQGPADADLNQPVDLLLDGRRRVALLLDEDLEPACELGARKSGVRRPQVVPTRYHQRTRRVSPFSTSASFALTHRAPERRGLSAGVRACPEAPSANRTEPKP